MEIYEIKRPTHTIKYGKYKERVFNEQAEAYKKDSAKKNLETATTILSDSLAQVENAELKNNVLLVGKVQSGKTSNLEMIAALAFDNDFNMMIIYGGYDNSLLQQCADRFTKTFNANDPDDPISPFLYSTDTSLSFIDDDFLATAIEEGKPIIICSMKRPKALNDINEVLTGLDKAKLKAFIIDDEGDQASLNTNKDSFNIDPEMKKRASETYAAICGMKRELNNPLYFAVTATPEANIFQPEISELTPGSVHLIQPANLYTGADVFHLGSGNAISVIDENDLNSFKDGTFADSLKKAVNYFIVASAIMLKRNINSSDMIIHVYREKCGHKQLYEMIGIYLKDMAMTFQNQIPEDVAFQLNDIKGIFNESYFARSVLEENEWDTNLEKNIEKVVKKTLVVLQNSEGNLNGAVLGSFRHKIYIGGDLLQRGLTFKHLVCTYFARWAKKGNMDTNLQRARWFGYRNDYIDLCKVFTTETIKDEFANLASIENDLWSQFSMVEQGQLKLNEVVIDADDTNLNPTRKNVANYKKAKFGKLWNNQLYASLDKEEVDNNNAALESLLCLLKSRMFTTSEGRKDGEISAYCAIAKKEEIKNLFEKSCYIFQQSPFKGVPALMSALSGYDEVCAEFMFGEKLNAERHRTFNSNRISALQQGADSIDATKQKYMGDSYVIADKNLPCIQVFNILPELGGQERRDLKQYMYSIHFPVGNVVFVKK